MSVSKIAPICLDPSSRDLISLPQEKFISQVNDEIHQLMEKNKAVGRLQGRNISPETSFEAALHSFSHYKGFLRVLTKALPLLDFFSEVNKYQKSSSMENRSIQKLFFSPVAYRVANVALSALLSLYEKGRLRETLMSLGPAVQLSSDAVFCTLLALRAHKFTNQESENPQQASFNFSQYAPYLEMLFSLLLQLSVSSENRLTLSQDRKVAKNKSEVQELLKKLQFFLDEKNTHYEIAKKNLEDESNLMRLMYQ